MALPSQTERTNENSRSVSGQPGSGNGTRVALVIAGLVLLAGGIYALNAWGSRTAQTAGTPQANATADTAPSTPATTVATQTGASTITPTATLPTTTTPAGSPTSSPSLATTPAPNASTTTTGTRTASGNSTIPFGATPAATAPGAGSAPANTPTPVTPTGATPTGATPTGTTPTGTTQAPTTPAATAPTPSDPASLMAAGTSALAANNPVEARRLLSRALLNPQTSDEQRAQLRDQLMTINKDLVFSPTLAANDPMAERYTVQAGDSLVRIARRRELATDWRLIQRVNRISNPNSLRAGQTLKLVRGPFHAVVNKAAYRVDVYQGSPDDPANWLFIKSYRVGLGEGNSTPLGNYVIKKNSKLVNPPWVNPRTGERFGADDPKNPIGEHWIGWQGVGDSAVNQGYGFHGTIEPDSIGQQRSMGCVRMASEDVGELYELLVEEVSVVRVLP